MKIAFNNVSKNYGSVSAIKDINFKVDPGEFVFVVGPSGAGKSTLLKLILHQITPSTGQILINDQDVTKLSKKAVEEYRRKIGVIFQDYQLIVDRTIEENIAISLDIISCPSNLIQSKVDEAIKKVNLANRRFLFPSQLSGGELQRAALARALAVNPELILADEPTGNLDLDNAWALMKLLKQINQQSGTSIIMTTHNMDIVESLGKRIIKLKSGSLIKAPHDHT